MPNNQDFLMHRIESYYNWKTFLILAVAFIATVSLYYLFPSINVSTMYFYYAPILLCCYALSVFAGCMIAIKKLKRSPQNFNKIIRIDHFHIFGVYFTIAIVLPAIATEFYLAEWWGVIVCILLIFNLPELSRLERWGTTLSPLLSLMLHYLFWNIVSYKPLNYINLFFTLVVISVFWLVQVITIGRRFDKKLLESDVPITGFMEQYKFTARELEILTLIFANKSTKEIAATLHISPETVRKHYQNIYQKTDTHSKMELLLLYNNS